MTTDKGANSTAEQEHTKGPWEYGFKKYPIADTGDYDVTVTILSVAEKRLIIEIVGENEDDEANARRIVACVNALEDISTDYLENFGLPHFAEKISALRGENNTLAAKVKELEGRRDELLAAVKWLKGWAMDSAAKKDYWNQINALIAKIEAEKSG